MTDEAKKAAALAAYQTLCDALDAKNWKYEKHPEELEVTCIARGDDLPMKLVIQVDEKRQALRVLSLLPVTVPEEKRVDMAVAISLINNGIVHGCFDYDVKGGNVLFRIVGTFFGCTLSKDACMYLVLCACQTIDNYNDKLLMLSKGLITVEQFITLKNEK